MRDVFGCYLTTGGQVEHSFVKSLAALQAKDMRLMDSEMMHCRASAGGIATGRNQLTRYWLDQTTADYMWMIDTDMGFKPDTLERLIATMPQDAGAVGALAFSWRPDEPDGYGGHRFRALPTIFGWDGVGFKLIESYPLNRLIRVGGTGAACLLIKREAAEAVRALSGDEWWVPVRYPDGDFIGEDLSFCYRLGMVGRGVYVDTSIKTTHAKTCYIGEEHWLGQGGAFS